MPHSYDPWAHALELGAVIIYGETSSPDHDAEYHHSEGVIVVERGLTRRVERCTVAHECVHVELGHEPIPDGPELWKREARVNRIAAERLVDPDRLRRAIRQDPHDPAAWCLEIDVTAEILLVYLELHPEITARDAEAVR